MTDVGSHSPNNHSVNEAIQTSCRMLALREHSKQQIRNKLLKKGFEFEIIGQCIDYLMNENWLSESRYCDVYIRSMANKGRGLARIKMELKLQGIAVDDIESQLDDQEIDWQQNCDQVLVKKMGLDKIRSPRQIQPSDIEDRIKLENFLRFRGFSREQINAAFKHLIINERVEF